MKTGSKVKTQYPESNLEVLEDLYDRFNKREYVHPDPLEFLYDYPDPADREIIGVVASSLAYGQVGQILKSVVIILERIGEPLLFLQKSTKHDLVNIFKGFKHRFTTGEEIAAMLYGVGRIINKHGSLEKCFAGGMSNDDETVIPALCKLVDEISSEAGHPLNFLIPCPSRGSACKRLNLFLRWMVRHDDVDPGGWYTVRPCKLLVPLDVHMHRIGRALGYTDRSQADMQAVVSITNAFREISPDDPVKYDFALTRLGIRDDLDPGMILGQIHKSD